MQYQEESRLASLPRHATGGFHIVAADRRTYYAIKRLLDISLASFLLLALLPIMIIVGIAIFIYSPGPIFFIQERVGAKRKNNGKFLHWEPVKFKCIKFRTMKLNADPSVHQAYIKALIENNQKEMDAVQHAATRPCRPVKPEQAAAFQDAPTRPRKLVDDARVIAPGKILRKLSLDELPQLINVLCGDMSMIGPRPAIPYEVEMYKPWHKLRLQAQPGITGLQQVTARCTTDFDKQVELDVEYIEQQSLWLDLKIAIKTPLAIISTRGAY